MDQRNQLVLERSAAVKRIVNRARRWGPMLHDTHPEPVTDAECFDEDLQVVLFTRGHRRLVMVWNVSTKRFVRARVALTDRIGGSPARRAVEVPGDPGVISGTVERLRRGKIALHVNLAPGDASLYEVF